MRARVFLLTAALVVGGACSSGGGLQGVSGDKRPDQPSSHGASIPPPGATAAKAPPQLPDRGPGMPPDTISLEEMHRQGRTDVVR